MEIPDLEEETDVKAALTGQKTEELELPSLFGRLNELRDGDEIKVTVRDIDGKAIKKGQIVNILHDSRAIIIKLGQKAKKFKTYTPIVVDGEIYSCVAADGQKKLVMFTYVGPQKKLVEMTQKHIESAAIAKDISGS